jgi:inner membrane protein
MDPVCHTLVGAALGRTGLEARTRYGRVTLIVAANLPDIDVVTHFMSGTASYAFRRGVTHGLPAMIVLPALLTLAVLGWHRLVGRRSQGPPMSPGWLLTLSLLGVATHPTLDWMNNYGMRWLMPVVNEWFYGDTLFIIDWILWLALTAGLLASRRRPAGSQAWYRRPSTLSLGFMVGYIAFNFGVTRTAEFTALAALEHDPPARIMASPVPFTPLRRNIVLDYPRVYRFAEFRVGAGDDFRLTDRVVPKGDPDDLRLVAATRNGGWFLHWARFPYSVSRLTEAGRKVVVADARYVPDLDDRRLDGFAVYELELTEADQPTAR